MTIDNLSASKLKNTRFAKSTHILWHLTTYGTYDVLIKRPKGYELLDLQGDYAYVFSLIYKTVDYSYLLQNYKKPKSLKKILQDLINEGVVCKKPQKGSL